MCGSAPAFLLNSAVIIKDFTRDLSDADWCRWHAISPFVRSAACSVTPYSPIEAPFLDPPLCYFTERIAARLDRTLFLNLHTVFIESDSPTIMALLCNNILAGNLSSVKLRWMLRHRDHHSPQHVQEALERLEGLQRLKSLDVAGPFDLLPGPHGRRFLVSIRTSFESLARLLYVVRALSNAPLLDAVAFTYTSTSDMDAYDSLTHLPGFTPPPSLPPTVKSLTLNGMAATDASPVLSVLDISSLESLHVDIGILNHDDANPLFESLANKYSSVTSVYLRLYSTTALTYTSIEPVITGLRLELLDIRFTRMPLLHDEDIAVMAALLGPTVLWFSFTVEDDDEDEDEDEDEEESLLTLAVVVPLAQHCHKLNDFRLPIGGAATAAGTQLPRCRFVTPCTADFGKLPVGKVDEVVSFLWQVENLTLDGLYPEWDEVHEKLGGNTEL